MTDVTLQAQAIAVELAAANLRGHCENLQRLVDQRKRPQSELDIARMNLPALVAAAETMRVIVERKKAREQGAAA